MKILLDSNAYSAFMRGAPSVRGLIQAAEEVLFSAVVVGELLYGFRQGVHFGRNLAELRSFLERPYVTFVPVGPVTADRYSRVMTALKAKGRPIPINDVWIAAHAMETGADLVSADKHFGYVDGIAWVRMEAS
ncbi:MAG: type II toxin-antitoxin system VapC family toxin [Caldilineaceae bacterium SB0665_bin_21]|nr:type II toxin-antitoxin system VapC family toxin [Caldilineaceae bacterium SB0665_bin_21]MYA04450.1 type II toxin-antitoxin system VapC family toxin [Caldilineaceae bacterium SB0664_bin_22]MYC62914.1 type II toxin-antitoxin system VapC family toxin [Caldilineaceae bacterium SB0661_bin_34]